MRKFLIIFMLMFSTSSFGGTWKQKVMIGDWDYISNSKYERITFANDLSGYYLRINKDGESKLEFGSDQVKVEEGLLIINFAPQFKMVLSAWGNGKKMLGIAYHYVIENDQISMINMVTIMLDPSTNGDNGAYIKSIRDRLHGSGRSGT